MINIFVPKSQGELEAYQAAIDRVLELCSEQATMYAELSKHSQLKSFHYNGFQTLSNRVI